MKCSECKYLSLDYLEGSLSNRLKAEMEQHLAECTSCCNSLEKLKSGDIADAAPGLILHLFKPSGGFKSLFLLSAMFTIILTMALIAIQLKKPLISMFSFF